MVQGRRPPFAWVPGEGFDREALARLQQAFARPATPMGEAWFMSEHRRTFPELLGDLSLLSTHDLQRPLAEIATGTSSFGAPEEWADWYHYLLARLIPRGHETYVSALLEILITGFIVQHPFGRAEAPYAGFYDDVLRTLGRCVMDPEGWPGGVLDPARCLNKRYSEFQGSWSWWDPSPKLSASLFLCLKYLPPDEVGPWVGSVLAIPSSPWRAQMLAWLVGAHDVLTGRVGQPSEFDASSGLDIQWDWSHCITGEPPYDRRDVRVCEFLCQETRMAALQAVRGGVTEAVFLGWLEAFEAEDGLSDELGDLPDRFWELYGPGAAPSLH